MRCCIFGIFPFQFFFVSNIVQRFQILAYRWHVSNVASSFCNLHIYTYVYTACLYSCVIEFGVASSEKFRARFIIQLQAICVASVNLLVFYANWQRAHVWHVNGMHLIVVIYAKYTYVCTYILICSNTVACSQWHATPHRVTHANVFNVCHAA